MPLFSWMKWSHETRVQAQDETPSLKISGGLPSRMLITELLWHVEERERLARELAREHRMAHSALGLHWFQKYPRLRTLIPSSELQQLEFLCAQIPSIQAATVLSRCLVVPMPSSVLTLVSCQQILAATASTGPDSRQSREDPKGKGARASCQESHYVLLSQTQAIQGVNMWRWRTPCKGEWSQAAGVATRLWPTYIFPIKLSTSSLLCAYITS